MANVRCELCNAIKMTSLTEEWRSERVLRAYIRGLWPVEIWKERPSKK